MMIRQGAISVKFSETDAAVTNFPGVAALANLGERLGLLDNLDRFFVNAVYMRLITLAYNLFIALKTIVLPAPQKPLRLATLLFRLLSIPALVTRHARRIWLKLPRGRPHAAAFATAIG